MKSAVVLQEIQFVRSVLLMKRRKMRCDKHLSYTILILVEMLSDTMCEAVQKPRLPRGRAVVRQYPQTLTQLERLLYSCRQFSKKKKEKKGKDPSKSFKQTSKSKCYLTFLVANTTITKAEPQANQQSIWQQSIRVFLLKKRVKCNHFLK